MSDLSTTIEPKSDQLNADSLLGGKTLTIKVTKVAVVPGDQPCTINYEGDNGRPYKPGKSMRRVLVHVWGRDTAAYPGRSMTLYADEKVTFGGMAVGGIRISHMSHIDAPITMALTATRGSKKAFTVKPLVVERQDSASSEPQGWRVTLWNKVQAAGLTQEQFVSEFGGLKSLPYSRLADVEGWIERMTGTIMRPTVLDPAVCSECGGLLIEGHCYSEACPEGEPPPEG